MNYPFKIEQNTHVLYSVRALFITGACTELQNSCVKPSKPAISNSFSDYKVFSGRLQYFHFV